MAFAIIQTVVRRLERRYERNFLEDVNKTMKLIRYDKDVLYLDVNEIAELERSAMIEIPEYCERWKRKLLKQSYSETAEGYQSVV